MKNLSSKSLSFSFAGLCVIVLCAAGFLQYYEHLAPCPLCILQRWLFALLTCIFFIAAFLKPMQKSRCWIFATAGLLALLGLGIAIWQMWLIAHPNPYASSCAADLQYLIRNLPFRDALYAIFQGTASCQEETFSLMGLNLPELSGLCFAILCLGSAGLALRQE